MKNLVQITLVNYKRPQMWKPTIKVVDYEEVYNLRTTAGIDMIADSISKTSSRPDVANYLALSSNSSAPAVGDTTLTGEYSTLGLSRAVATYSHTSGHTSYTLSHTWTATGTFTSVQKNGVFNAASVGTLVAESLFSSKSGVTNDTLTVTHTINF